MAQKKSRALYATSKVHQRMQELAKKFPNNPELKRYK